MRIETPDVIANEITGQTILNWLLPALGVLAGVLIIWFVWRYLRDANQAGRVTEFNERTFKKLIENESESDHKPFCTKCKLPMRVEVKYKDFMQDTGEFPIKRESLSETLLHLVKTGQITKRDSTRITEFFNEHSEINEQLFKRFKCTDCDKIEVLPYKPPKTGD